MSLDFLVIPTSNVTSSERFPRWSLARWDAEVRLWPRNRLTNLNFIPVDRERKSKRTLLCSMYAPLCYTYDRPIECSGIKLDFLLILYRPEPVFPYNAPKLVCKKKIKTMRFLKRKKNL